MNESKIKNAFWKIPAVIFALSLIVFVLNICVATSYFKGTIEDTIFGNSPYFMAILVGSFSLGVITFLISVFAFSYKMARNNLTGNVKGLPRSILVLLFNTAFLPIILIFNIINPKQIIDNLKSRRLIKSFNLKSLLTGTFQIVCVSVLLLPIWVGGYVLSGSVIAERLGYITEDINIVGTGSMYPTWPKGTKGKDPKELAKEVVSTAGFLPYPNGLTIGEKTFFGHTLGRGDIITWENDATRALTSQNGAEPAGLLKRLIGLPGDKIELRDGIVYLNSEPQKEPYTAKPRSTFGEKFLKECQVIVVPDNEIFAMGDNRKGSADSREIGFAPIKDISRVLPLSKQKGKLDKNWHDTSMDLENSSKARINTDKYLELLNEKRKEAGVKPLKYQIKLQQSASKRGEVILKFDDFSFEATRSGYPMQRAMNDVGYSNIVYGEAPVQGYYESEELLENQFEFPDSKKFYLEKDYQEIGIAEVEGMLNGCPTQVIVLHFAGYVPPNYKQSDIDSWKPSLEGLKGIQSGWNDLKNNKEFYDKHQSEVNRINEIISTRISRIDSIINTMTANKWLSSEQEKWINEDLGLFNEQQSLSEKLNSY
ncbi:MAG: hypothetical protein ACD_19C00091G0006 [uncultured bacterium]|nr:MAG: hypothetical protein ACD_19C00091G0006 [uncultured bacterium]